MSGQSQEACWGGSASGALRSLDKLREVFDNPRCQGAGDALTFKA
jgi:hypothetical protein